MTGPGSGVVLQGVDAPGEFCRRVVPKDEVVQPSPKALRSNLTIVVAEGRSVKCLCGKPLWRLLDGSHSPNPEGRRPWRFFVLQAY